MSDFWQFAASWPLRMAVAGGGVLLVGRVLMWLTRQPARRSAVGLTAVAIAFLTIPLSLLPGWLPVRVDVPHRDVDRVGGARNGGEGEGGAVAVRVAADNPQHSPLAAIRLPETSPSLTLQAPVEGDASSTGSRSVREGDSPGTPRASTGEDGSLSSSLTLRDPQTDSRALRFLDIERLALVVYVLIALGLLARLILGQLGLARIWRLAAEPPEWAERIFRRLAIDVCPRARLRISDRAAGPVCFGVLRPRVLVPASLIDSGDTPGLRCVFAHELGHLNRRDPLTGWLLGLSRAIYFVWPWLIGLRREVRLAQEYLADADAARHAAAPADYAELLIRMTRARPAPLGAAGARGPGSDLYRRVTMLLRTKGQVEARCPRRWKLAIVGGLMVLAVAAAGIYVQPRSAVAAEPEKKESPKPPAVKTDGLKELIEKLQKDVGDDPEKKKQLEELKKQLKPKPADPVPPPQAPPVPPLPDGIPNLFDPDLPEDALLKELLKGQEDLLKQLQQMMGDVQAGRGIGFRMGPDGNWRPIRGGAGGGRLGIRVEKPSDVLASQLDLPSGKGLVCVDVPAESNAGKIGIKPNDILLEVGGKAVSSDVSTFAAALKEIKADTAIDIVVLRKGKKETLKGVKLPEAKEVADVPGLPRLPNLDLVPIPLEIPAPPIPAPGVGRTPPPLPAVPGRGIGAVAGPGETVRVEQVNDAFTVFYSKNGLKVTITGSKEGDGPPKAESIEVDDNGKTTKAESIDKLPKQYQDIARSAMKAIK